MNHNYTDIVDLKLETNTGEFTLILGVQVVSVYSYDIEPATDYCICAWQWIVMRFTCL